MSGKRRRLDALVEARARVAAELESLQGTHSSSGEEEAAAASAAAARTGATASWGALMRRFRGVPSAELSVQERALARVAQLQRAGEWAPALAPRQADPHRQKVHWDFLLAEMRWLAADYGNERSWRRAVCRAFARACAAAARARFLAQQQHRAAQRRLAAHIAHAVLQSPIWNVSFGSSGSSGDAEDSVPNVSNSSSNALIGTEENENIFARIGANAIQEATQEVTQREGKWLLSEVQERLVRQVVGTLGAHGTCVVSDATRLSACKAVCAVVAGAVRAGAAPCAVVLARGARLRWWAALQAALGRAVPLYAGGSPRTPRVVLATTADVAAAEAAALGTVAWACAVVVAEGLDADAAAAPRWDAVCAATARAAARILVLDSSATRATTRAFTERSCASSASSSSGRTRRAPAPPSLKSITVAVTDTSVLHGIRSSGSASGNGSASIVVHNTPALSAAQHARYRAALCGDCPAPALRRVLALPLDKILEQGPLAVRGIERPACPLHICDSNRNSLLDRFTVAPLHVPRLVQRAAEEFAFPSVLRNTGLLHSLRTAAGIVQPAVLIPGCSAQEQEEEQERDLYSTLNDPPKFVLLRELLREWWSETGTKTEMETEEEEEDKTTTHERIIIVVQDRAIASFLGGWLRRNYPRVHVYDAATENEALCRATCALFDGAAGDARAVLLVAPCFEGVLVDRLRAADVVLLDHDSTPATLVLLYNELHALACPRRTGPRARVHVLTTPDTHEGLDALLLADRRPTPQAHADALRALCASLDTTETALRGALDLPPADKAQQQSQPGLFMPLTRHAARVMQTQKEQEQEQEEQEEEEMKEEETTKHPEIQDEDAISPESPKGINEEGDDKPEVVYSGVHSQSTLVPFFFHETAVGYPFLELGDDLYIPDYDYVEGPSLLAAVFEQLRRTNTKRKRKEREKRKFRAVLDPRQHADQLYMPTLGLAGSTDASDGSKQSEGAETPQKRPRTDPAAAAAMAKTKEMVAARQQQVLQQQQQQQRQRQSVPSAASFSNIWTTEVDGALFRLCQSTTPKWRFIASQIREISGHNVSPTACAQRLQYLSRQTQNIVAIQKSVFDLATTAFPKWRALLQQFSQSPISTSTVGTQENKSETTEEFMARVQPHPSHAAATARILGNSKPMLPPEIVPLLYKRFAANEAAQLNSKAAKPQGQQGQQQKLQQQQQQQQRAKAARGGGVPMTPGVMQGFVVSPQQQPQAVMMGAQPMVPHPVGFRMAYTPVNGAAYAQYTGVLAQPQYIPQQQQQQQVHFQQATGRSTTGRKSKTSTGGITTVAPPPPVQGAQVDPMSGAPWVPVDMSYMQRSVPQMVPQQLVLVQPGQPVAATPLSPQFVVSPQIAAALPTSPQIVSSPPASSTGRPGTTTTNNTTNNSGGGGGGGSSTTKGRTRGTTRKHH